MSRIGKLPVAIPKDVKVDFNNNLISAAGPKGSLDLKIPDTIDVKIQDGEILVLKRDDSRDSRRVQGLIRSLVDNVISGVSKGFEKKLNIVGVGYKAAVKGDVLNMALGYSHPINYKIPSGINIDVDRLTSITVSGLDKQLVGSVAAKIRSFRPPEPYKGKGIKYKEEFIKRKVGKAGKK
jgi:large subunit ribosomal protein L6